ncbi:2-oxo acid dehydrogenase subunit E2 [Streptomyces sp. NPDC007983]|uniref:2-oxo acid dehydrogenase subunit E2 n=1 Tax=Streptomyces sp. NPDC007983 TaxID=3364800 RepID=UPI0036E0E3AB
MSTRLPRERRHTLLFLREIRAFSPVYLDTEVDMTAVQAHRTAARAAGRRYSLVSYVVLAAGQVLAKHPEANAAVRGRLWPKVAHYPFTNGKVTLDKQRAGHRVVLATVVPRVEELDLQQVQTHLDRFRDGDPDHMPEFAAIRRLHQRPWPLAYAAFRKSARSLAARPTLTGTYAVTSLGHRDVDGFHSVGGTTVTVGVGRVVDRPVVRGREVDIAPVMRLSLAFDHRVIDGSEAADVLTELKSALESYEGHE